MAAFTARSRKVGVEMVVSMVDIVGKVGFGLLEDAGGGLQIHRVKRVG